MRLGLGLGLTHRHTVSGGGGGPPEWVPEGAKIYIDLVGGDPQGRAWVDGVGEVAVSTQLGTDPNTENGWGASSYSAENLVSDGYRTTDTTIGMIGALRAQVLAGATIVFRFLFDTNGVSSVVVISADGNSAIELDLDHQVSGSHEVAASSWTGTYSDGIADIVNQGATNLVAWTLTPTRSDIAANGSEPVTSALTTDDFPVEGGSPIVAALVETSDGSALQSITVYDALADTIGLAALTT